MRQEAHSLALLLLLLFVDGACRGTFAADSNDYCSGIFPAVPTALSSHSSSRHRCSSTNGITDNGSLNSFDNWS